jgi:L-malate glycosyltransferase
MGGSQERKHDTLRIATVLSLPLSHPGGVTTFVSGLLGGLGQRAGLELSVIQPDRFKGGPGDRVSQLVLASEQLFHLLRLRPDVVHNHEHPVLLASALVYAALARRDVRVVHTVHVDPAERRSRWKRLALGWLLSRCWAVTTVARDTASRLSNIATPAPRRVRVIYGATSIQVRTRDDPDVAAFGARFGLSGTPVICQVGPFNTPLKVAGIVALVEAFALVRQQLPAAQLLLVGDGRLRGRVEAARIRSGVAEHIIVTGFVPDVALPLALADLYCQITLQDACPIGLLEAMASARPVVAARVGGIPELITHGADGLLVDPSPGQIASAIVHLHTHPDEAGALAAHALATARARFTWGRAAAEFVHTYTHPYCDGSKAVN